MRTRGSILRSAGIGLVVAATVARLGAAPAHANVPLTQVSSDPFTNPTSQHATEVEPDNFAFGSTVVGTFQVGRFFSGGGTDIGFVRSGNGGATWDPPGFLPGMTFSSGAASPYERVSDASVAYDVAHLVDPAAAEHGGADGLRQPLDRRRPDVVDACDDPAAGCETSRPRQE